MRTNPLWWVFKARLNQKQITDATKLVFENLWQDLRLSGGQSEMRGAAAEKDLSPQECHSIHHHVAGVP